MSLLRLLFNIMMRKLSCISEKKNIATKMMDTIRKYICVLGSLFIPSMYTDCIPYIPSLIGYIIEVTPLIRGEVFSQYPFYMVSAN